MDTLKALLARSRVDPSAQRDLTETSLTPAPEAVEQPAHDDPLQNAPASLSGSDEQTLMATVRGVCTQSMLQTHPRLRDLSSIDPLNPKHAQLAETALQSSFNTPEKLALDVYRRPVEKLCRHTMTDNMTRTHLRDCHSCLTPGQHVAYRPVVLYYAQTGRTDYVKAVLAHQWPCTDREAFAQLACGANGVFALFPDTSLVLDLAWAESHAYMAKMKRLCLSRRGTSDAEPEETEEANDDDDDYDKEGGESGVFRNPNFLQEPHVRGMALRQRRQHLETRVTHFLSEARQHSETLQKQCRTFGQSVITDGAEAEPVQVVHTTTDKRANMVEAGEEEAFDFFEEEEKSDGDRQPTSTTAAAAAAKTGANAHASPSSPPAPSSSSSSSAHIQNQVYSVVWGMDTHQFQGRYMERKVPAVAVVPMHTHMAPPPTEHSTKTPAPTSRAAKKPAMTSSSSSSSASLLAQLPPVEVLDSDAYLLSGGSTGTDSDLTRFARAAEHSASSTSTPARWFTPRLQRDAQSSAPLTTAPSTASTEESAGLRSTLSAEAIAAHVSELALYVDAEALQALLKVASHGATKPTPGSKSSYAMQLPVRVHVVEDAPAADGAPPTRARLQVYLGRPFPAPTVSRRRLTTTAFTALLDGTVAASASTGVTLLTRAGVTELDEVSALPLAPLPSHVPLTVVATSAPASPDGVPAAFADVELRRAADPLTGPTAGRASSVPTVIPLRVLHPPPWWCVADGSSGEDAERRGQTGAQGPARPVFRLVKTEYLNATDAGESPSVSSSAESRLLLEAMSIDEAVEISSILFCFPDALVLVCRVHAYTGAILASDVWDKDRWSQFLARQSERARLAALRHASANSAAKPTASRGKRQRDEDHGTDEATKKDATDDRAAKVLEALSATPSPLTLSTETLTLLDHAWDCLFDILDRLCLQLSTLCAQQLSAWDPDKREAAATEAASSSPPRPLLTLDYVLSSCRETPAAAAQRPKASLKGRKGSKPSAGPPLFKVTLKSPDSVYRAFALPARVAMDVSEGRFIEGASYRTCHEQYLPPASWPYADRLPFTFQP